MDRRQRRTRQAIFEAFDGLLARKSYSEITVQEIIDRADVGRSTFYAHFETKDQLLREMCAELFSHVTSSHPACEATHDFSGPEGGADSVVVHILYHLRDDSRRMAGFFRGEGGELFLSCLREYLGSFFRERVRERAAALDVPEDFLLDQATASFVEMVRWWLRGGRKQSPEELERWFASSALPL